MHNKDEVKVKVEVELEFPDIAEFEIWEPEEILGQSFPFMRYSPFLTHVKNNCEPLWSLTIRFRTKQYQNRLVFEAQAHFSTGQ